MSIPDPINPEDHGEEIPSTSQARERENDILAMLQAELDKDQTTVKLAKQLATARPAPVVPDGGNLGRTVAPVVEKTAAARETLRLWGPAIATTGLYAGALAVFPVTGPLAVYGFGLVGFAWWHCAGRPGLIQAIQMLIFTASDALARIREWVARLAERRGRYESRRTNPAPKQD
ncbi:hypothetical protein [Nocardia cyriacigeorgica]|uniref:hypothetical protein n=1 Tax=Nocardia cyriacigeorgica TaxID=135487 RepID=UPI003511B199